MYPLFRKRSKTILLLLFIFLFSCSGGEFTTQHFSFPPGSIPHENKWQYLGLIKISSGKKPITIKSKKNVMIKITDKNQKQYLKDNLEFDCASIKANIIWRDLENIKIELIEKGNKFSEDAYNIQLVKEGPNKLIELKYKFDNKQNLFIRVGPS